MGGGIKKGEVCRMGKSLRAYRIGMSINQRRSESGEKRFVVRAWPSKKKEQ